MKQHSTPIIIKNNQAEKLEKIALNTGNYDEHWIQSICFQNPDLLPVMEIEPSYSGMVPVCMELATKSGSVDLIFLNESGFITIGECKLWRNPEARRKVIGQVLDYAKDIAKWDYSKFETECLKSRKDNSGSLIEVLQEYYPDTDEALFVDSVQNNLKKGRFLLAIIGDGIRENMEEIALYIQRNGNLNFTLGLIELPVYASRNGNEIIITPRILAKTVEIERTIYRISETAEDEKPIVIPSESLSKSQSEKIFFERLHASIGKDKGNEVENFIKQLYDEFNMVPKIGRGKQLSMNLKSYDDTCNFASIQENGEVWFYGIVNKTEELGDKQIGVDYLLDLGNLVGGNVNQKISGWNWGIKKAGHFINITEYLLIKDKWLDLISRTLGKIQALEENR